MKRTLIVSIALLIVLACAACKSDSAVVICGNCATKISETCQYCPSCGVSLFQNSTNSTNPNSTLSPTTSPATTAPSTTEIPTTVPPTTESPSTEPPTTPPTEGGHDHRWKAATCTVPKTCETCGETEGSAIGHNWKDATCTAPKTCKTCSATTGSALGHSYSKEVTAATCSQAGYTTYTCKCGDSYVSDYVAAAHNYKNYLCTSCGQIDKSHAYDYLISYVKENGTTYGSYTTIEYAANGGTYKLSYSASYGNLSVQRIYSTNNTFGMNAIYLDSYFYGTTLGDYEIAGYLTPSTFTANSAITYTKYAGPVNLCQDVLELARVSCCDLLDWLTWYLSTYNVGITIADLGFTAY